MRRSVIETVIGAVVIVVAGLFLYFTYSSGYQRVDGYDVMAKFNRVDGLTLGSEVRLSGIKVGRVVATQLDPDTYLAIIHMSIDKSIKLPLDTVAKITSDGLLGSNYIALEPGGDQKMIGPGGQITSTQDPINITDLVGRFIFGGPSGNDGGKTPPDRGSSGQTPPPTTQSTSP